ncbi:hypothetical protein FQA39_LY09962 [Lamprigera yunnana]|nr:hypothetical protein FQA39_LY09962 [Lamprigera yunnana]
MFKLENYITPLLFSYVDKYIKNFRPEDSQVSLWGGDASFHNLDLRLEVLEEELHLPFSFVSGHIHELLIHVPWTKLASEPITVTINTIECILKVRTLNEDSDGTSLKREHMKKITNKREEVETPPGYVQSLINKIVSNIKIFCNNLILKYVEEDIVVSMNIKLLTFESANEKWEPAYTDISAGNVIIRKLITVSDLTICIDKRNAAGKIDVYQEPVLYRCSLVVHMLRHYHTATVHQQSVIRIDIHCSSMEFSMTEQQVPMLMRVIVLLYALQQKELISQNHSDTKNNSVALDSSESLEHTESWAVWAWSFVPSLIPIAWDEDWSQEQEQLPTGHTLHVGFYVDFASLTFKVSETNERGGYYYQRKIKYLPLLTLNLQGIVVETITHGLKWFNCQVGVSQIVLFPVSHCSCGYPETPEGITSNEYLKAGLISMAHKVDSLFDSEAVENKGLNRMYNMFWDYHMETLTESVLLERTPAFAFDYLYQVELFDDDVNDHLSELGSDLEYSNLREKSFIRIVFGPLRLRVKSGFFHRISSLRIAASTYDYQPYSPLKSDPSLPELPPPCAEDFDALSDNIPWKIIQLTVLAPIVEFQVMDHPYFQPTKRNLFYKCRKSSTSLLHPMVSRYQQDLPRVTLECQCIDARFQNPMYPQRLVKTVCQLPEPPQHMFDSCYTAKTVNIVGLCSQLITSNKKQTTILLRSNFSYNSRNIIKPQYWAKCDIPHMEFTVKSENVTLTATKPKFMLVFFIISKLFEMDGRDTINYLTYTSIIHDVSKSFGITHLEVSLTEIWYKKVMTNSTVTIDISLGSIKAFIYDPANVHAETINNESKDFINRDANFSKDIQQILFVSGPESNMNDTAISTNIPLFLILLQYPLNPNHQPHPSILKFSIQEMRICVDPVLCKWLLYTTKPLFKTDHIDSMQRKNFNLSEASGSALETPRKVGTPHESIHSNSDKDHRFTTNIGQKLSKTSPTFDCQEWLYTFLIKWGVVWNNIIISGDIQQCIIYFPLKSLVPFGTNSIEKTIELALRQSDATEMFVVTLPEGAIHTSLQRFDLSKYLLNLPVKLPSQFWTDKTSLPWTVSLTRFSCYTLQGGKQLNFLKPISLNVTIGISTKTMCPGKQLPNMDNENSFADKPKEEAGKNEPLGVCIHIDMSPITLCISEVQVCLIFSMMYGLSEVLYNLRSKCTYDTEFKSPGVVGWSSNASPTLIKESTLDSISEKTPSTPVAMDVLEEDTSKLTVWIQWTITKLKVQLLTHDIKNSSVTNNYLYNPNLKLVIDIEDIVSSLDCQCVYLKIKTKIAALNVQHFKKKALANVWVHGRHLGIVMKICEEQVTCERQEDFATITITRASCHHTHVLWGTVAHTRTKEAKANVGNENQLADQASYITEVVISTQPIDVLLSLTTLRYYYMIIEPVITRTTVAEEPKGPNLLLLASNQNLPLLYVECRGIRIIIPTMKLDTTGTDQNVCMLQIGNIGLSPSAVNPICRNPSRPDIYQLAAQSRILNIPGSEIEDRQYQLDIKHISAVTGLWSDFSHMLKVPDTSATNLRTMSENPALEWNKLGKSCLSTSSHFGNFSTAINKFDISIIIAPAMIYKNTLICGHSIEVNCESDVEVNLSLNQIKLISTLVFESMHILEPFLLDDLVKRPCVTSPYLKLDSPTFDVMEEDNSASTELGADSGFETSEFQSIFSLKSRVLNFIMLLKNDLLITVLQEVSTESTYLEAKQLLKHKEIERNVFLRPSSTVSSQNHGIPIDFLVTGGKIVLSLYEVNRQCYRNTSILVKDKNCLQTTDLEKGYEASEESSLDEKQLPRGNQFVPLLFLSFSQPNIFISQYYMGNKVHISCFDVSVKITGPEYTPLTAVPVENDYSINLLETLSGIPNPGTGIRPAFFTLKWIRGIGQPATVNVEFARPTRIFCSAERWAYLFATKDKVVKTCNSCFQNLQRNKNKTFDKDHVNSTCRESHQMPETYTKFNEITKRFYKISAINFSLAQIVLVAKTENNPEVTLSLNKLKNNLTISRRPERIINVTSFEGLTLGVKRDGITQLLLNPWTLSVELSLTWESWQSMDSDPMCQVSVESDCIMLDISPEQIKSVQTVVYDFTDYVSTLSYEDLQSTSASVDYKDGFSDKEQFYKDDLRAGAFQFVDSITNNVNELPLPYQVVFWKKRTLAMAWRYPQPRALIKVRVFPVPFKLTAWEDEDPNYQIFCNLEYWSECHNCYRPYLQFYLSENESSTLTLPENNLQCVSSTWRVFLTLQRDSFNTINFDGTKFMISPRMLAACMRIDSYFNKKLVPNLSLLLDISTVNISLRNDFNKKKSIAMPLALKQYKSDMLFPDNICFGELLLEGTKGYLAMWNYQTATCDVTSFFKSYILDYASLTRQSFIDPFLFKFNINYSKTTSLDFICNPIKVKFGLSIAHTLMVSAQLWEQNWKCNLEGQELIIMTRYIVCNNTNVNIRFGQVSTDENILLLPHYCHFYCWRTQKTKQMIRAGMDENGWLWSHAFQIDNEGMFTYQMSSDESIVLVVTIKNLSATQKQIIFSGQLVICNMLLEHFEMKVVVSGDIDKEKEFKRSPSYIIPGKSFPPTLLLNGNWRYHLRLRFFGLESAWSGDIPITENCKSAQPWLVKVPLQERGQFLSIWCRTVIQPLPIGRQILVIFWPLFMIRSNLPVNSTVHISTPTLGINLEATIHGRGECQQLYCPGTIDHSHQLSFQLDNGTMSTSNTYVPLNYSLVDQKEFFKRPDNVDIAQTLAKLTDFDKTFWPYFEEDLAEIDWIAENQPLTYVQVRYQNACEFSSALLVELLPWSLIVNTLGCSIAIVVNENEVCRVSHHGIVTPPKLEETFHIAVDVDGNWNFSSPLQLATSEWSSSFYMPKITGTIPLEGDIRTAVICNRHICMVSILSKFEKEIRLLKVSSSHVLTNNTTQQLNILCLATLETEKMWEFPKDLEQYSFTLASNLDKSNVGTSIIQWYIIGENVDLQSNFALYISISINPQYGWSCPVRVDKIINRRCIAVQIDRQSIPIVISSQTHKGQMYLALHNDLYPQLLIDNRCGATLYFAQGIKTEPGNALPESQHFDWKCEVQDSSSSYYTMPSHYEKFPDLSQENGLELVVACEPEDTWFYWSKCINLYDFSEVLVSIPILGDVQLHIYRTIHTTFIVINSSNQVEISAKDIRVRLYMQESETAVGQNTYAPVQNVQSSAECEEANEMVSLNLSTILSTSDLTTESETFSPLQKLSTSTLPLPEQIQCSSLHTNTLNPVLTEAVHISNICECLKINVFIKEVTLTLISNLSSINSEMNEIGNITLDNIALTASQAQTMVVKLSVLAMQFDNQMYSRGNYDFPVILIGQEKRLKQQFDCFNTPILKWINDPQRKPLLRVDFEIETWRNFRTSKNISKLKDVKVEIRPLLIFIEDNYIMLFAEYVSLFSLSKLIMQPQHKRKINYSLTSLFVGVPEDVSLSLAIAARPWKLCALTVEPISLLLSVHWSVKLYIALDQSPLQFSQFEKKNFLTSSCRLGNALAMHYITGAIFGAGWMVGSLELLGTPGGLARAMGTGLRDFVNLPFQGFLEGPWGFIQGITYGSASLMRHITAGTLQSVTKLASSVARNLDRLTLDDEHLRRTEEQRRNRPHGVTEGLMQGLTGLGISLLGAVGGIAHHPMQSMLGGAASPRSFVAGVGLGLVGVIAKPLSGAAELVALTGQGILEGAGWCLSPSARLQPLLHHTYANQNSVIKYSWKFTDPLLRKKSLFVMDATWITNDKKYEAVTLILTTENLIIINCEDDVSHRILKLVELISIDNSSDPTLLNLRLVPPVPSSKGQDEHVIEMDPACRARVADFVKSTVSLLHFAEEMSPDPSEMGVSPCPSPTSSCEVIREESLLSFYVNPQSRNYFLTILMLAKHQLQNYSFPIL